MNNKQDNNISNHINTSYGLSSNLDLIDQSATEEMIQLLKTMEKLVFLCHNYDLNKEIQSNEVLSLLNEFQINDDPDNPFAIQNQILVLTDQTENQIKAKIQ